MASPQILTLGALLRRYRIAAGLTQEELAEKAGLSVNGISALERGVSRAPRRETIALLAEALGLQLAERTLFERAARQRESLTPAPPREESAPAAESHPFVGRTVELAALDRFLAAEGPPVLLVSGEPGIGKTRLLAAAAERARLAGWEVVVGTCLRLSVAEPYAPFPAALLRLLAARSPAQRRLDLHGCAWLARLLPELTETDALPAPTWSLPADQERRLIFAAVGRLLANVARPAGTLLLLDDLQWAGDDALALLAALLRGLAERTEGAIPLRVALAYRETDVTPRDALEALIADCARDGLVARLALGPLAPDEAAALLDTLLAEDSDEAERERMLRRAAGVPYFLVSVAQGFAGKAGRAVTAGEVGGVQPPGVVPWSVATSIRQRVEALSEPGREVVALVAVAGSRVPPRVMLRVAEALGREEARGVAAIEEAVHARLLAEAGEDAYACAHDLIREVVVANLAAARRGLLHRLIGEAIERLPESDRLQRSAELAWHFAQAQIPERALPYALLAGERTEAVYAHAEAERHYRMALDLAHELGDQAREAAAYQKLGMLFDNLGRLDEAIAMLDQAARGYRALGDRERLARATHRLARATHRTGKIAEGVEYVQELVVFLTSDTPSDADDPAGQHPDLAGPRAARALDALAPATAALVGGSIANYLAALGRAPEALPVIEAAAARARRAGDVQVQVVVSYMYGNILRDRGRLDDAERAWDESSQLARGAGMLDFCAIALSNLGLTRVAHGELAQARSLHVQAIEEGTLLGDPYLEAWSRGDIAELAFIGGEWSQARTELESALDVVRVRPPGASRAAGLTYGAGMPLALLGRLDLAEGRTNEGLLALDEVLRLSASSTASGIRPWAQQALAEYDLLMGDPEAARKRLEPVFSADASRESALPAMLAWALLELGARDHALQMVETTIAFARARRLSLVLVEALPVLARGALSAGRLEDAAQAAAEALALARALPYPYAEAKALFAQGLTHAGGGDTKRAVACHTASLAILRRLGEELYQPHIERALAALDGPPGL